MSNWFYFLFWKESLQNRELSKYEIFTVHFLESSRYPFDTEILSYFFSFSFISRHTWFSWNTLIKRSDKEKTYLLSWSDKILKLQISTGTTLSSGVQTTAHFSCREGFLIAPETFNNFGFPKGVGRCAHTYSGNTGTPVELDSRKHQQCC